MADDITLRVGGSAVSGWTNVHITRSAEHCPNPFTIGFTDAYPDQIEAVTCQPGDPCQVLIGSDVVVTGYVDRLSPTISPQGHSIEIVGRGKSQDLVDCSAEWDGCQIVGANALEIAQKLAKPYGITAMMGATAPFGPAIPQFNFALGETAFDIVERVCRFAQLLVYEDADGNLVLAQAGTDAHASGFKQGDNVEAASTVLAVDQRFSEYHAFLVAIDAFEDVGQGGNEIAVAYDGNVKRNRKRFMIADTSQGGLEIAQRRALWEASRRLGRGTAINVTADSWRDSAGKLWQPNWLAPVEIPACKVASTEYVIAEVNYMRDNKGTRAQLSLLPKGAFLPEPVALQPAIFDSLTPLPPGAA